MVVVVRFNNNHQYLRRVRPYSRLQLVEQHYRFNRLCLVDVEAAQLFQYAGRVDFEDGLLVGARLILD